MLHRTRAGDRETELKLFAVMPTLWPPLPRAVTTVIPVAKLPSALRRAIGSILDEAMSLCFLAAIIYCS